MGNNSTANAATASNTSVNAASNPALDQSSSLHANNSDSKSNSKTNIDAAFSVGKKDANLLASPTPSTSAAAASGLASPTSGATTANAANGAGINGNSIDLESFVRDWRHFECQTWHLEPTVRLLSWAGKSIEPYGIDYILNKLGFAHARTTIPKWLQRGFMDPLDKVQALMMLQLLTMVRENKVENSPKSKSSN